MTPRELRRIKARIAKCERRLERRKSPEQVAEASAQWERLTSLLNTTKKGA